MQNRTHPKEVLLAGWLRNQKSIRCSDILLYNCVILHFVFFRALFDFFNATFQLVWMLLSDILGLAMCMVSICPLVDVSFSFFFLLMLVCIGIVTSLQNISPSCTWWIFKYCDKKSSSSLLISLIGRLHESKRINKQTIYSHLRDDVYPEILFLSSQFYFLRFDTTVEWNIHIQTRNDCIRAGLFPRHYSFSVWERYKSEKKCNRFFGQRDQFFNPEGGKEKLYKR